MKDQRTVPIGKLRHRLMIQTATNQQTDTGNAQLVWTTADVRWGSIEPLHARELFLAQQTMADVTHRITLRYYPDLTPKDRIIYQDTLNNQRIFNIYSILNVDEVNRKMVILVKEQV